jgi:arylsulfatase A-like enzyme
MDEQIGKILDGLEASGKMDNTYIIFAADHGLSVGQHGLLGKQNMYDHSMRVPLIISGRNISQNKAVETDVYVQDIMPTVLELAGINKPAFVDFYSILPFTKGQGTGNYPSIYGAYTMKQRMIRSDGFKLIAYPRAKKIRLFNLNDDPLEMNDLSDNTDFKAEKDKLWAALLLLQKEMNDPLNLEEYISN